MKRVVYHRLAAAELIESALFYDRQRDGLGNRFLLAVDDVLDRIRTGPELAQQGDKGTRSFRVKRFPYRFVFLLQPDRTWIVAVAHASRKPGYWARRLK